MVWFHSLNCFDCRGWYNHTKGAMERGVQDSLFRSLAIVRPAMIYPGNSNSPESIGLINQVLNPILPEQLRTASTTDIAMAMKITMEKQIEGRIMGTEYIIGGQAIRDLVKGQP